MGRLSLALLGTPDIRHAGQPVTFATRKTLALLIYLAVEGGPHAREALTALFWPESPPFQARATLRNTLAFLRTALGVPPGRAAYELATPVEAHLIVKRNSLAFDFTSDVDLDLNLLESAERTRRSLSPRSNSLNIQTALDELRTAAAVARGEFLEGLSLPDAPAFDDWTSFQRERWQRKAMTVFDRLSELQADVGEPANAIETTTRWVRRDPLNEAAHRRLIQLHFSLGDRAAALRANEACRAILERELNAEPAPETRAVFERWQAEGAQPAGAVASIVSSPAGAQEAPLIGRAAEHLALAGLFRTARRGAPQLVSVEGEPGIGKSRLAREFVAWARGQGATAFAGRAFELGQRWPFQPMVEALRAFFILAKSLQLSPTWLAEFTRLLPELADAHPDWPAPLPLGEAEARTRLFEALFRLVQAQASRAPVVWFIDDLQWADPASLDWLAYMCQRWAAANTAVLLLCTARSEDLGGLETWLAAVGREMTFTRLALQPLTQLDTLALGQALSQRISEASAGPPPAQSRLAELYAETGGHPLFIIETVRALQEQGVLPGTAPGVREVIRGRLLRLGPEARAACAAAAVLGARFDTAVLVQVVDMSEAVALEALENLYDRGLLRESGRHAQFTHDKIREVAYADLSAVRRLALHRRALEALGPSASSGELAHHALAAGLLERAFQLFVSAGDEALKFYAARNATAHYEQAYTLSAQLSLPVGTMLALHVQRGKAYEQANNWAPAGAAYETLLDLARAHQSAGPESIALNNLALVAAKGSFDIPTAVALLREAQEAAVRSGYQAVMAETEMNLAQMGLYLWNAEMMRSHAERALALGRELGQPAIEARCLNSIAYSGVLTSDWNLIERYASDSKQRYLALGNRLMAADSQALLGASYTQMGRLADSLQDTRAAYVTCLELENDWGQANCAYYLAHALLESGHSTQALAVARNGVSTARAAGHPPLLVFNLIVLGTVYRALFALDQARQVQMEALAMAQQPEHIYFTQWAISSLCATEGLAGQWTEAHRHAQALLRLRATDPRVYAYIGFTLPYETEALVRAGEIERAAADVERFGRQAQDWPRYRIPYLRARAVLAAQTTTGELLPSNDATNAWLEAAALAETLGLPHELWPLYALLGERQKGAAIAQALAAEIDDAPLREAFLRAEPIRSLLA